MTVLSPLSGADLDELEKRYAELEAQMQQQALEMASMRKEIQRLKKMSQASESPLPLPEQFPDSNVPAQSILGKVSSTFDIKMYGFVKVDAMYNSGNADSDLLPTVATAGSRNTFEMTAQETRIGFNISGPGLDDIKTSAKIETDFFGGGGSANLRLRRAFVKADFGNGWSALLGQEWDTGNLNVLPKVLNFRTLGGAGWPWGRRAQARVSKVITFSPYDSLTLEAAIADPATANVSVPSAQWNIQYARKMEHGTAKLGFHGYAGKTEMTTTSSKEYDDNLFAVSAVLPIGEILTLQGQYYMGEALDSASSFGSAINTSLDTPIEKQGGFAQVKAAVTDRLTATGGFGWEQHENKDLALFTAESNLTYFGNLFYKFADPLLLGMEYQRIKTDYKGTADASLDRIQFSAIFLF